MSDLEERRLSPTLAVVVLSALVAGFSVLVLLGWRANIQMLTHVRPHYDAIVPSTAASFAALAAVLPLSLSGVRATRLAALALTLVVIAFVACNVLMRISGGGQGIDAFWTPAGHESDRMAFATAGGLIFAAVATLAKARRVAPVLTDYMLLLALSSSLALLVGQSYEPGALVRIEMLAGLSIQSTILFVVLFSAILLMPPGSERNR